MCDVVEGVRDRGKRTGEIKLYVKVYKISKKKDVDKRQLWHADRTPCFDSYM